MDKVHAAFPEAIVDQDNYGQLVIYTNLQYKEGIVKRFENEGEIEP